MLTYKYNYKHIQNITHRLYRFVESKIKNIKDTRKILLNPYLLNFSKAVMLST